MKENILMQSITYANCSIYLQIRNEVAEKHGEPITYVISLRVSKDEIYKTILDNYHTLSFQPLQVWNAISNPDTNKEKILLRVIKTGDVSDYIFHMEFSTKDGDIKLYFKKGNIKKTVFLV